MCWNAGFRLIGIGLAVWTVAVAGSGASMGFWSLVFCRMLVGVGEASFVSLASPFIGKQRIPCLWHTLSICALLAAEIKGGLPDINGCRCR